MTPTAAFTYVKEGNVVEFTNASSNATSYLWDFGDGATSTDLNPVHIYAGDGDYTVTLTAYDDAMMSGETSQVISISSAVFTAADLSSPEGKTWRLDGENSYIVGPGQNSGAWWNGLDAAGVIERACQMDDEFTFFDDGTMVFNSQGQVWAEDYMGGTFACTDDAALTPPFDAFGSGTHTFTATDSEITVNGLGAYVGWNKAYNRANCPPMPQAHHNPPSPTRCSITRRTTAWIASPSRWITAQPRENLLDHAHDFRLRKSHERQRGMDVGPFPFFVVMTFVGRSTLDETPQVHRAVLPDDKDLVDP